MMYATHKAGGALFALIGFEVLTKNQLLETGIDPWLELVLMYPACSFGSVLPDLDHGWGSVKEHTPFSMLCHKIIHLSKPSHRSWQTHCLLVAGAFLGLLYSLWYAASVFQWLNSITLSISLLLITGLSLGVASHLVLDTITMAGIWLVPGVHFRLVPNKKFFGTDTPYETFVRRLIYVLIVLTLIWVLNPFGLQEFVLGVIQRE